MKKFARLLPLLALVATASLTACAATPGPPTPAQSQALFDFHSVPWINLHHVLYQEGLRRAAHPDANHDSGLGPLDTNALSPTERTAWDAAVTWYATAISPRNLTFDAELETIHTRLAALEANADADPSLPTDLKTHLTAAMPVYRSHWWAEHDRANRAWTTALQPLVARHGQAIAQELARAYDTEWPREPVRVDASVYACWEGAYTTLNPVHVTIGSLDPGNAATAALEIVFHEFSHLTILPLKRTLAAELAAQNKASRELWHVLLFFTVGEIVKRHVGSDYVPYAEKQGLYERVPGWGNYHALLRTHWAPHLEGRTDTQHALRELARAL